jgi:hypothetical protein
MENLSITKKARDIMAVIITGVLVIVLAILMSITFKFGIVANLVMSWLLTTFYALFAFFFINPELKINPVRIIEKPVFQTVEVPVDREVIREIQIPMENRIIEVVEKPVIKEVFVPYEKEVVRIIRKTIRPRKRKLNIPLFKFVGSTQAKRFHKRNCRLGKLIKKKNKIHSNTKIFFQRKHFKSCDVCIKKIKKI